MMRARPRTAFLGAAGLVVSFLAVTVNTGVAGAAPQTIAIGIDHAAPAGHNWSYVDFFPRSGINVHSGDVLDFQWATLPDGLHTATILKTGETPQQASTTVYPPVTPDPDDGANQLQGNPSIDGPSNPPPGSGAPGACGDTATPCTFSGTSDLNSGARGTIGSHFVVHVAAPAGTYDFVCLIHPGMHANFTVVDPTSTASTPSDVAAAADAQATSDTNEALATEAAAPPAQVQNNPHGTHTVTATAGTATPYVDVNEMLPQSTAIQAGDTVKWATKTIKDIHTVTFPQGSNPSTEPLPFYCEASPDVLQNGPPAGPGPPCGDPTKFEAGFNVAPSGGTVISSPATVATTGLIANPPTPLPSSYSFSFPNAGTYTYQCRVHDHMVGTVQVAAVAVSVPPAPPATPVAGRPDFNG